MKTNVNVRIRRQILFITFKTVSFLFLAGLLIAVNFLNGCGESKKNTCRVGILCGLDFFSSTTDGFKSKMTELGYIEGKNIVYDVQESKVDHIEYRQILNKFLDEEVDLIFVFPTEAAMEAKTATQGKNTPVVFANVFTENTGLIDSAHRPGGNITGVRWVGADIVLKRFEIMQELVPGTKRILIPYMDYPIVPTQLEALRPVIAAAGLSLVEIHANNAKELEAELQIQAKSINSKTDFILLIAEPLIATPVAFPVLGKFADEHNIPIGGVLMSEGGYESIFGLIPQNIPQGKQAAILADKILKGAKAGTIPVVSAESFLQINYKKAKKLGLNVSEGLLNNANEIIR